MQNQNFWRKFFSFSGRVNRLAYFLRCLVLPGIYFVSMLIVYIIIWIVGPANAIFLVTPICILMYNMMLILLVVSSISLCVRRLHDINLSGLWYFAIVAAGVLCARFHNFYGSKSAAALSLSVVCLIMGLIILFCPGTKGSNKFGANPLQLSGKYGYRHDYRNKNRR